jgi:hypothetical protein
MTEGDVRLSIAPWTGRAELYLTRHNVNGALIALTVAGALEFSVSSAARAQIDSSGAVLPAQANTTPLRASSLPWSNIYSQNAVTVTSDQRAKTVIAPCPRGLDFICALHPVAFRHVIGGVTQTLGAAWDDPPTLTPRPGVRVHTDFLAQDVRAALPEGFAWAGWCLADKDDPDGVQALRYEALIAPLVKAV